MGREKKFANEFVDEPSERATPDRSHQQFPVSKITEFTNSHLENNL